jgi:hypothetical protein
MPASTIAAIKLLVKEIATLSNSLSDSVPKGTKDDKIWSVMDSEERENAHETFNRRFNAFVDMGNPGAVSAAIGNFVNQTYGSSMFGSFAALLPSSFSAAASGPPAAKKPVSSIPVHNSSHGPVVLPAPKSIPFHDGSHGPTTCFIDSSVFWYVDNSVHTVHKPLHHITATSTTRVDFSTHELLRPVATS